MTTEPCAGVKSTHCRAWPSAGHAVCRFRAVQSPRDCRDEFPSQCRDTCCHRHRSPHGTRHHDGDRGRPDFESRVFAHLGLAKFLLACRASPPGRGGAALAGARRHVDPAFAVQARQTLDDRRLCRCDDRRSGHIRFPAHRHAGAASADRACRRRGGGADGAGLALRPVPRAAARKRWRWYAVLGRARGAIALDPDQPL